MTGAQAVPPPPPLTSGSCTGLGEGFRSLSDSVLLRVCAVLPALNTLDISDCARLQYTRVVGPNLRMLFADRCLELVRDPLRG
jgi:hypothetical protein